MDLQLDETTWDVVLENGDIPLLKKSDAIRQHMKQRFWIFQGEYFLDETVGVPYFQKILGKKPNLNVVDAILKDTASNTPGILELIEFELEYDPATRALQVASVKARALDGDVDFESLSLNQAFQASNEGV